MKINSLGVHLKTNNFTASKRFYQALGFKRVFEYGPDCKLAKDASGNLVSIPESYRGMTFAIGNAKLEIADGHRAVKLEVFKEKITSSKQSLMITIDDMQAFLQNCRKNGIPFAVEPRHYYWGTLETVIKDPDGTVLVFIAPYEKQVARHVKADETWAQPPK